MSGSYRFIGIAALVALIFVGVGFGAYVVSLAYGHGEEQCGQPANGAAYTERDCPRQIDTDRAGLPYLAESIASNPEPKDSSEREQRDLAAQESMSVWAFWMMTFSAIGIVITSVGTGFLLWQIILTRKAVEGADNATMAMRDQNNLTQDSMRPWLEIETDLDWISDRTKSNPVFSVMVTAKNIGKLPARNCNIAHVLVDEYQYPVKELREIAASYVFGDRLYLSKMIVLPGGQSSDQELLFFTPTINRHAFGASFMIIITYDLPSGGEGRSAAWFKIGFWDRLGEFGRLDWDDLPPSRDITVRHEGYMHIT